MGKGSLWQVVAAVGIMMLVAVGLAGCGGGGDDNGGPVVVGGTVSGRVLHFDTDQGLGGVAITVGGQTAVSDNAGNFTVRNVPVGNNQVVTITPPEWLAVPGLGPILVNVFLNQDTVLQDPIRLVNAGERPPDPPN